MWAQKNIKKFYRQFFLSLSSSPLPSFCFPSCPFLLCLPYGKVSERKFQEIERNKINSPQETNETAQREEKQIGGGKL